jgi:hypothetical protein
MCYFPTYKHTEGHGGGYRKEKMKVEEGKQLEIVLARLDWIDIVLGNEADGLY